METQRLIRLLMRTLTRRGVRQAIQSKLTGNDTSTPDGLARARQVNDVSQRASKAIRMFRRFSRFL